MKTFDDLLQGAFDDLAAGAPHDPLLATRVRRRSRYRRAVTLAPFAAAAAVIAVIGTVVLAGPGIVTPGVATASACTPLTKAVLPTWARTGFTDPVPSIDYVTSRKGDVVAIIFAPPLHSTTAQDGGDKILWAARELSDGDNTLTISGRLEGGSTTMKMTVPGAPGPSGVAVPAPGCWVFDLTWGTYSDTIDIRFEQG